MKIIELIQHVRDMIKPMFVVFGALILGLILMSSEITFFSVIGFLVVVLSSIILSGLIVSTIILPFVFTLIEIGSEYLKEPEKIDFKNMGMFFILITYPATFGFSIISLIPVAILLLSKYHPEMNDKIEIKFN
jgi:hypothetical protein